MEINDDNATERYRQIAQEVHDDAMMYRDKLEAAELRIAELEQSLERQAKAAISGMDAAKAVASSSLEHATRLHSECSPEALESERAANALLTERIAELEEREAALAVKLNRIIHEHASAFTYGMSMPKDLSIAIDDTPATSLAHRDLIKQAEALDQVITDIVSDVPNKPITRTIVAGMKIRVDALRQQAEAQQ